MTEPNLASRRLPEAGPESVPLPETGTGERSRRRQASRRQSREQLLSVLILVAMLALTVVVLLGKWMDGTAGGQPGQPVQSGQPAHHAVTARGVPVHTA